MATYFVSNPGNLAIQREEWTLSIDEARAIHKAMDPRKTTAGSYWMTHFLRPMRSAIRAKRETLRLSTAGFSTSEFAGMAADAGVEVGRREVY